MNRLFVDVGNSKLKWRLYIAGSRKHDKCGSHEEFCAYLGEVSLEKPVIDSVKISCVKNNETTRAMSDLIATKLNVISPPYWRFKGGDLFAPFFGYKY